MFENIDSAAGQQRYYQWHSTTKSLVTGATSGMGHIYETKCQQLNICVNVINPGPISTNIGVNAGLSPEAIERVTKMMEQLVPLGRTGETAEITGYVAFLLSEKSYFVLGTELTIDGGMTQL